MVIGFYTHTEYIEDEVGDMLRLLKSALRSVYVFTNSPPTGDRYHKISHQDSQASKNKASLLTDISHASHLSLSSSRRLSARYNTRQAARLLHARQIMLGCLPRRTLSFRFRIQVCHWRA